MPRSKESSNLMDNPRPKISSYSNISVPKCRTPPATCIERLLIIMKKLHLDRKCGMKRVFIVVILEQLPII